MGRASLCALLANQWWVKAGRVGGRGGALDMGLVGVESHNITGVLRYDTTRPEDRIPPRGLAG